MPPQYTPHQKLSLRRHPTLNEPWLHDRICDDPSMLGLGDVRVLDRERTLSSGGRLDLILLDDRVRPPLRGRDPTRRDRPQPHHPGALLAGGEYWDLERRRYPAYEHVAVIIAEDITTRFLNVMALMSGVTDSRL